MLRNTANTSTGTTLRPGRLSSLETSPFTSLRDTANRLKFFTFVLIFFVRSFHLLDHVHPRLAVMRENTTIFNHTFQKKNQNFINLKLRSLFRTQLENSWVAGKAAWMFRAALLCIGTRKESHYGQHRNCHNSTPLTFSLELSHLVVTQVTGKANRFPSLPPSSSPSFVPPRCPLHACCNMGSTTISTTLVDHSTPCFFYVEPRPFSLTTVTETANTLPSSSSSSS